MKKYTGSAFAFLAAFVVLMSGSAAQAQGIVDTLKGIASDPSVDNFLRNKFSGYGAVAPMPAYGAYGVNPNDPLYYSNANQNGGLMNLLQNKIAGNGFIQGNPYANQYPVGYAPTNGVNGFYDPNYLYGSAFNNGTSAAWNTANGAACQSNGFGNSQFTGMNGMNGGCSKGKGHHRHHHRNQFAGGAGGPRSGFYTIEDGAPIGGIGYNPYTMGR